MSAPVIELVGAMPDGLNMRAYACGSCRHTHGDRAHAAACCVCHTCGRATGLAYVMRCDDCQKEANADYVSRRDDEETARLAAAPAVPEAEYVGWVFWDNCKGHNEGYFEHEGELREWCLDHGETPPERVWACREHGLRIDGSAVLDEAFENAEFHE